MQTKDFAAISQAMQEAADPLYKTALLRLAADVDRAGRLAPCDGEASHANPACGDRVTVTVRLEGGRIAALAHDTKACVLTQASAALLARIAPGLDSAGVARLEDAVRAMLKQGAPPPLPGYDAFDGAAGHAGRHVCVLLPFAALRAALNGA